MDKLRNAIAAWWARNICAVDPHPEYSNHDRMDGLR